MPAKKWVPTSVLADELGVSSKFLWNNRTRYFEAKKHYKLKNPNALKPTYTWHLKRCEKHWDELTDQALAVDAIPEPEKEPEKVGRGTQLPLVEGVEPYELD